MSLIVADEKRTRKPLSKRQRREIARRAKAEARADAREPNGRRSRRKEVVDRRRELTEAEAKSVAIEARMRHYGLSKEQADIADAGKPNAGTVHGLMRLRGHLSADQFQAADWFLGKRAAYMRAIQAADNPTGPSEATAADEAAHVEFCRAATETWESVRDCIQQASIAWRTPIMASLDVVLVRNQYLEHLAPDLKRGLNAIHRRFLEGAKKAS